MSANEPERNALADEDITELLIRLGYNAWEDVALHEAMQKREAALRAGEAGKQERRKVERRQIEGFGIKRRGPDRRHQPASATVNEDRGDIGDYLDSLTPHSMFAALTAERAPGAEQQAVQVDAHQCDCSIFSVARICDCAPSKVWVTKEYANSLAAPQPDLAGLDVLYDGYAVLQALDDKAKGRTSAENVSDVLDAVVRLIRGGK